MSASNTTAELARPRWWGKLSLVLFLLGIVLPIVAWLLCRPLSNASEAIYVAGGLVALLLFVLVVLLSRVAGWHAYMLRRLINFGIVFGVLGVGMGVIGLVNGTLDPHPREEHEVQVLSVPETFKTRGPKFEVEDWREGRRGEPLRLVDPPDGIRKGDRVVVVVGPGLLCPWLDEVRRTGP